VASINILVSALSQTPIYLQIQNQIKELVLTGKLNAGEQLPSIRLMAKDLKVGIITVSRAYEELEKEGIIQNLQGRGCFIADINADKVKAFYIDMLNERLIDIKQFTDSSAITKNELLKIIDEIYAKNGGRKK
jgi:GntR family transcriptional regulator